MQNSQSEKPKEGPGRAESQGLRFQFFSALLMSFLALGTGLGYGWSSVVQVLYMSQDSPTGSPWTENEFTRTASVSFIAAIIITFFSSFIVFTIGRRNSCLLLGFLNSISWALLLYPKNNFIIYLSRFIHAAAAMGSFYAAIMHISETTSERTKATMVSLLVPVMSLGTSVSVAMASTMDNTTYNWVCLVLSLTSSISLLVLPESPVFYMEKNRKSQAEKALSRYRGGNERLVAEEIDTLQKNSRLQNISYLILFKKKYLRTLEISFGIGCAGTVCGVAQVFAFMSRVYQEAGVTATWPFMIVAVFKFIGSCTSPLVVHNYKRKPALYISYLTACIGFLILGIFFKLKESGWDVLPYNWVPPVVITLLMFLQSTVISPLPLPVVVEIVPPIILKQVTSILMSFSILVGLVAVEIYGLLLQWVGYSGNFFTFSAINGAIVVFTCFRVPETKGVPSKHIWKMLGSMDQKPPQEEIKINV